MNRVTTACNLCFVFSVLCPFISGPVSPFANCLTSSGRMSFLVKIASAHLRELIQLRARQMERSTRNILHCQNIRSFCCIRLIEIVFYFPLFSEMGKKGGNWSL